MKTLFIYLASAIITVLSITPVASQNIKPNKIEYKVVINHEEQYSIWPVEEHSPEGWKDTSFRGNQRKCQQHIRKNWTDMRPLSIQKMDLPRNTMYVVVINHEEQYSIWPTKMDTPANWRKTEISGSYKKCTDHIKEVWTDMRPLSIRKMNG